MINDSEENPSGKRKRIAIAAGYLGGKGRTPGLGESVLRNEWPNEAGENVSRHVHPGPREGAGTDSQLNHRQEGAL
jgi:hypothetical protein